MRQGSPGVAAVPSSPLSSPSVVPHRPKDKENAQNSPRTIRPQPPPPLGISARTDVDIYRYNQGTTQRMAIRPIFEQRKEEGAQIARNILAAREGEEVWKSASSISAVLDDDLGRDEQEQFAGSATNDLDDDEEQTSKDKERKEFTTIRFVSPRSADVNRIRAAPVEACEDHIGDESSVVCQDTILAREEDNEAIEMLKFTWQKVNLKMEEKMQ
uniref:Uncharacterized protein n=1 Tax=Globisporangium ultimum (strain ATCC 200006 / CBS 805.95 / DAOM BR144) TaxID=431595 RepID=K3WKY3_GLOUD